MTEIELRTICGCSKIQTVEKYVLTARNTRVSIHIGGRNISPFFQGDGGDFPVASMKYAIRDFSWDGYERNNGRPLFREVYVDTSVQEDEWRKRYELLQKQFMALERQFYFIDEGL